MAILLRAFEGTGRLKTRSLSVLPGDVERIEQLFRDNGVQVGTGYLGDSVRLARKIGRLWGDEGKDCQPTLPRDEQGKLIVAYRLSLVAKALADYRSQEFAEKLKTLSANNLDPGYVGVSSSREVLFELEILARLRQVSRDAQLREPPGSDIRMTHRSVMMQIECKYINSTNPKTVLDRIGDACEQLNQLPKIYGLIAVEIDSFLAHEEFLCRERPSDAYRHIAKCTRAVFMGINPDLQMHLRLNPVVRGLLVIAHAVTLVGGKNCIDVGICNIANAAGRAPQGSQEFDLLLTIARDLRDGLPD